MADRIAVDRYPGVYYRELKRGIHNGKPDRSFCYSYEDGKKHWVTVGLASQGVTAKSAYNARLAKLSALRWGEEPTLAKKPCTLDEVYEAWLPWAIGEGQHTKPETYRYNRHIKRHFGALPIGSITLEALDKFKAELLGSLSPGGAFQVISLLRRLINFAIKRRLWQGVNPVSSLGGFTQVKADNKGERFLTPAEANMLLAELEKISPVWHDMAFVALHSGMRLTELLRLKGQDINEATLTAIITAKGGQREPVLLTQAVLEVLLRNRGQPGEPVFRDDSGQAFTKAGTEFNKAVENCGFNHGITNPRYKVWFHTLRHTFASWLAQAGVGLYALMKLLRHHNIEHTKRYAHLIPDRQRDYLNIIDKMMEVA